MKKLFAILIVCTVVFAAKWSHFSPTFNTGANDTTWIVTTADDTSGAFALSPSVSVQVEIQTGPGDSSKVGWYPVYASKAPGYISCGEVPLSKFRSSWGNIDSTDFYGVYDIAADSSFSKGVNISPTAACPCARIVVKGHATDNDSARVVIHISRYEE